MPWLKPLLVSIVTLHAADGVAAVTASGRNWRLTIDSIECDAADSALRIGARIHYLGPHGPVEAPVSRLVDGKATPFLPRSLVWKGGDRQLAKWLPAGGFRDLRSEYVGEFQFRFDLRGAAGELKLEFGDIRAFPLTRSKAKNVCESMLKPDQIQAPQAPRLRRDDGRTARVHVYRGAYPCRPGQGDLRTTEARQPPHLPRQLLLFGRGYLPGARQVELPMGTAPAQPYAYSGADDLVLIEDAARRAIAVDFPAYAAGLVAPLPDPGRAARKYFAFNWGAQKAPSGNDLYSIGIYEIRPCG